MVQDPELIAMGQTFEALKNLDKGQVGRVIRWVKDRFGVLDAVTEFTAPAVAQDTPAAVSTPQPATAEIPETPQAATVEPDGPEKKGLMDYDTVMDLFANAEVKKVSQKILLMAAFLQERQNFKEISSYDINFRLKRLNQGVQNISSSINGLLNRKPEVMVELERSGSSKQARRKFRVTIEGLRVAAEFLKSPE